MAEHFGSVVYHVWVTMFRLAFLWMLFAAMLELHADLRQTSLGKTAGEDKVTAEWFKFGGAGFWETVARVYKDNVIYLKLPQVLQWLGWMNGVLSDAVASHAHPCLWALLTHGLHANLSHQIIFWPVSQADLRRLHCLMSSSAFSQNQHNVSG